MDRCEDNFMDVQSLAQFAHRLRERWPHVDAQTLDETAAELWADEELRSVEDGRLAAERWLAPPPPDASIGSRPPTVS